MIKNQNYKWVNSFWVLKIDAIEALQFSTKKVLKYQGTKKKKEKIYQILQVIAITKKKKKQFGIVLKLFSNNNPTKE